MKHKRTWTAVWAVTVAASVAAILAPRNRDANANAKAAVAAAPAGAGVQAAASDMAKAGLAFWNALEPEQQKQATFSLNDEERLNWHFVPKARKGLTLKEMSEKQRELAFAFLRSGLSEKGFATATGIMQLDSILREMERGRRGPTRDPQLYYFTLFGTPAVNQTWGWRVEGHHLSINILIADGKAVAAAPTFWGSNPHEINTGPRKGERLLAAEEDLGRTLVKSLTEPQRRKAIFDATAPKDIITGASKQVKPLSPDGVPFSELTAEQQQTLTSLVNTYAHRLRAELAAQDLKKIQDAGWEKVHFAWAGGMEKGSGHYYRVQGPTFLIEYDNTQNNANHVHSVWRDFKGDFGDDLLKKHHEEHKH